MIFLLPQAEGFKQDFEEEREDRENAHSLKDDMRLACDLKVQVLEEAIQTLTQQLEGASNEDLENSQAFLKTTIRPEQYQDQRVWKV